jgi:cytochrome c553
MVSTDVVTVPKSPTSRASPNSIFIIKLIAFRQGQRKHPIMSFFSAQMTQQEMREIVEYYSGLTPQF